MYLNREWGRNRTRQDGGSSWLLVVVCVVDDAVLFLGEATMREGVRCRAAAIN